MSAPASASPMRPLAITAYTATTAVGPGIERLADALRTRRSGLVKSDGPVATFIGRVDAVDEVALPEGWAHVDCRSNRLAWLALQQDGFVEAARAAVDRHGASRVALYLGTSTSTIAASEAAYRSADKEAALDRRDLHHLHATTAFVRDVLGVGGPCATVSTACSSSAKVFAQAARAIALGIVDAAVVGGVDTLAGSTLFGFRALGLVSADRCRPFDVARDGINLGEGAGFALLERHDGTTDVPLLIGYGESSDAHHMSAPHPEGLGARLAIDAALARAHLDATAIDYINLHGTATPKNDEVEAVLVAERFPARTRASSTKGWTGHTLGAAGIVEAIVTLIAIRDGPMPGTLNAVTLDPACGPQIAIDNGALASIALSHAFAFGGNNCVLAFARDATTVFATTLSSTTSA